MTTFILVTSLQPDFDPLFSQTFISFIREREKRNHSANARDDPNRYIQGLEQIQSIQVLSNNLAARRDTGIVVVAGGVDTESTASESFPENTLVRTSKSVGVGLDPSSAGSED